MYERAVVVGFEYALKNNLYGTGQSLNIKNTTKFVYDTIYKVRQYTTEATSNMVSCLRLTDSCSIAKVGASVASSEGAFKMVWLCRAGRCGTSYQEISKVFILKGEIWCNKDWCVCVCMCVNVHVYMVLTVPRNLHF